MAPLIADIIENPRYVPHRVSLAGNSITFIPADPEALRSASFIDGRSDFSSGVSIDVDLRDILNHPIAAPGPDRLIFHVGFCGSTLLSRLLDQPGQSLVLREPNCLADLANHVASADRESRDKGDLAAIMPALWALLRRRWDRDEPVVVKPSNWINNIAPDLCAAGRAVRPLFLTMPRAAFVRAVFRGGPERLAFAARAAVHLSTRGSENAELVAAALGRSTDQPGKLAALAVVAHEIQMRLLREAAAQGGWSDAHWLTLDELASDPRVAARKAADALAITLPEPGLDAACERWLSRHAKQPDTRYSAEAEADADRRATADHGADIDAALRWAEDALR